METKHTKEYAKKIAEIKLENGTFVDLKTAIVWGYMKAIEETAVHDLLEALIYAVDVIKHLDGDDERLDDIKNAINKATKQHEKISIKNELKSLKEKGDKNVILNGWEESIDYVLTLHTPSLVRIREGVYLSEPIQK